MIDGALFQAFVAFADLGGFTRAAKALHVSQPALHAQIKRLEEAVGRALYQRVGRGVVLTPDGVTVLAHAREAMEREAELRAALEGASTQPVVLAAGEGAFLYLLGPAIRRFRAHEHGALRLWTRTGPECLEALASGRAHLAVAALSDVPREFDAHLVAKVGAMALVPKAHRLAKKRALHVADLGGEPLVVPPLGSPHRDRLAGALAEAGASLVVAVEAQGWEPIAHFAQLGLGIAVVNDFCRVPPGMVGRRVSGLPTQRYFVLSRRTARLPVAAVRLRDAILDET